MAFAANLTNNKAAVISVLIIAVIAVVARVPHVAGCRMYAHSHA